MSTTFWLTDADADIQPATGAYKRAVMGGRGDNPSLVRSVTATAAGPTAGVQVTRSSGGTALAWITDPLDGTDLTAAAWELHAWAKESDAAANTALRLVISKWTTSASATVLDDTGSTTELTTTMADYARTTAVATVTTMADGDRLLFTIYADDAASSMAASHTVTLSYGGTYPRAEGDTYLVCPDTLALTAELPAATETSIRRVLREEQGPATTADPLINQDEVRTAFDRALTEYNRIRPREIVEAMSGDGTTYDFPLPSRWIHGFSSIRQIEHPTGEQRPVYLDGNDYRVEQSVLGRQPLRYLRFFLSAPESGTDNVLLTYTTRHVHTDELDTLPPEELEAVCWLAASWVADARSADEADTSSPTINADVVNYREGVTRWARVASRLRDRFQKHVGADSGVPAAGGFVDWDVASTGGGDRLFHRNRWR